METKIVQIGNSKGLRLAKTIIEKYGIGETVNLRLEDDCIVIEPIKKPRLNWAKAFIEMNKNGHDELLINDSFDEEASWD